MNILRASGYRQMPWKNGGGVTTEIAVSPAAASVGDFGWRISMAQVASDGPFSCFDGIDRTLTVLSGAGLMLDVDGEAPQRLTPTDEPFAFPGDVATSARLIGGPVIDFNVMTRRGRWSHSVENLRIDGGRTLTAIAGLVVLFCRSGELILDRSSVLAAHDTAFIEAPAEVSVAGSGEALAIRLIEIPAG
jgi:environmental stress-induced protein Ves